MKYRALFSVHTMTNRPPAHVLPRLATAAGTGHLADQIALTAVPLLAVASFGLGPEQIGMLVAIQGGAWFVASLPAGTLVDRYTGRLPALIAQTLAAVALALAGLAVMHGRPIAFTVCAFLAALGAVVVTLAVGTLVPRLVAGDDLPRANSRIELSRALASISAPIITAASAIWPPAAMIVAAIVAGLASRLIMCLPPLPTASPGRRRDLTVILAGAAFVRGEPVLRALALCAICWNFAFFALVAIFLPFAVERTGLDAASATMSQGAFGVGSVAAAVLAPRLVAHAQPRRILVAGPVVSVLAATLIGGAGASRNAVLPAVGFALLGFGPMLWLVCQTTLRQLVTPPMLLGRVTGAIQMAIYGARPLGALAAGLVAARHGLDAGMALVVLGFAASAAVAILSPLGRLRAMPEAAAST
ncbi:MAG: MFS transporter [Alphaproteobacteria bacterium]|nr:MFS transporter [Alphaproteobacteria bacterium]